MRRRRGRIAQRWGRDGTTLATVGLLAAAGLLLAVPSERSVSVRVRRLEACEDADDDNAPVFADSVVAVVISLIILTIIFEKLHDVLEEKAKEMMHGLEGVVDALTGELTVLGPPPAFARAILQAAFSRSFIGLVSFAVVKAGVAKHLSTHIFTPATESPEQWKELAHCAEGELGEIIEDMHMSLFGMMVGYIVQVIFVISVANNNSELWHDAERTIDDKEQYHRAYNEFRREQRNPTFWCKWTHWCRGSCCCGTGGGEGGLFTIPSRAYRIVSFDRLKARFISQANKHHGRLQGASLGSGFMLSHYLSVRQHAVLESLVELPVSQWLFMIVLALALRVGLVLEDEIRLWALIAFGWLILLVTLAIRLKVARIVKLITPQMPRPGEPETPRSPEADGSESIKSTGLSRDESLAIFLDASTTTYDPPAARRARLSGRLRQRTENSHRHHRAISVLPSHVQVQSSKSPTGVPAASQSGSVDKISSTKQSDLHQGLLPESDVGFQLADETPVPSFTDMLHGQNGLLRTPPPAMTSPQLTAENTIAVAADAPVLIEKQRMNASVQIQELPGQSAHPTRRGGKQQISHTNHAHRLTRHESFRELLPAYLEEGKFVDELFWLHRWRGHCCLRTCGGDGHGRSHGVPEHVEIKKWLLSLLLLLNTVYVTVLLKEGLSKIAELYSPVGEDLAKGSGSTTSDGYLFGQGRQIGTDSHSSASQTKPSSDEEARDLFEWLGFVATISAACFPPVFFLFFVVPHALLDYITVTSVEKFIQQKTVRRVIREQKEATLRHVFKMLAMVRRQALLFSHLLDDNETKGDLNADLTELPKSHIGTDNAEEATTCSSKDEHVAFRTAELEPEQLAEIKIMFKRYDQDGSGVVDFDEFAGLVSELGGGDGSSHDWHDGELRELFSRLDTDGGGTVDFDEFARFTAQHFQPLSVEEECDLIIALISGGSSGNGGSTTDAPVTTMELRGFLRGHARGFLLNDLSRRRIMLPADSIAEAPDQQTERWTDCTIPGARLCAVTRDVEGSDGTLVRRGDSIVITERMPNMKKDAQLSDADINMVIRAVDPAADGIVSIPALKELLARDLGHAS